MCLGWSSCPAQLPSGAGVEFRHRLCLGSMLSHSDSVLCGFIEGAVIFLLRSRALVPHPWDDSALFVPPGHSVPACWHPLQASGPALPVPAPAGPGGGASPSAPKIHSSAPSYPSPAFQLVPGPAGPLGKERGIGVGTGPHRHHGTSFP